MLSLGGWACLCVSVRYFLFPNTPFGEPFNVEPIMCTSRVRMGEKVGVEVAFAPSPPGITLTGAGYFYSNKRKLHRPWFSPPSFLKHEAS